MREATCCIWLALCVALVRAVPHAPRARSCANLDRWGPRATEAASPGLCCMVRRAVQECGAAAAPPAPRTATPRHAPQHRRTSRSAA
ncbi:uncharacterized protein V1510DRAFT_411010 [Dipodascopsis tothii]|uniref:uncharacterized protein n=1 Tax=Dipodascopsis tothii TaxID=44089 RepID=UPI0034CD7F7E